jgi:hypothetical protein
MTATGIGRRWLFGGGATKVGDPALAGFDAVLVAEEGKGGRLAGQ